MPLVYTGELTPDIFLSNDLTALSTMIERVNDSHTYAITQYKHIKMVNKLKNGSGATTDIVTILSPGDTFRGKVENFTEDKTQKSDGYVIIEGIFISGQYMHINESKTPAVAITFHLKKKSSVFADTAPAELESTTLAVLNEKDVFIYRTAANIEGAASDSRSLTTTAEIISPSSENNTTYANIERFILYDGLTMGNKYDKYLLFNIKKISPSIGEYGLPPGQGGLTPGQSGLMSGQQGLTPGYRGGVKRFNKKTLNKKRKASKKKSKSRKYKRRSAK
jgi:hypothetical protein